MTELLAPILETMPARSITVEEWAALPETKQKIELIEGVLQVAPAATFEHNEIVARLLVLLRSGNPTPATVWVTAETDVRSGADGLRPDLIAGIATKINPVASERVLLAVEVESPSSLGNDRIMKPRSFSRSSVPSYWRISRDPLTVHIYELRGSKRS